MFNLQVRIQDNSAADELPNNIAKKQSHWYHASHNRHWYNKSVSKVQIEIILYWILKLLAIAILLNLTHSIS